VDHPRTPANGSATAALEALVSELETCIGRLQHAHRRAQHLLEQRRQGMAWFDIVTDENRPLIVESISSVLASLTSAGHVFRREQARALHDENVSINRIANLFGVSRQRISALLRSDPGAEVEPTG